MPATTPLNRRPRILVLERYPDATRCVRSAGGVAITVNPRDLMGVANALSDGFDALLLTGGGDIDPRLYGQKPHRRTYGVNETRDGTELMALEHAAQHGLPVLGICRGMQLMAVYNGGLLKQHILGHRGITHPVYAETGTNFRRIVGNEMDCESLHHQRVRFHGPGFRVGARADDGTIEAIESTDGRCLGVQFHPEIDYYRNIGSKKLFRWLVATAAQRAGLAVPTTAKPKTRASRARASSAYGGRRKGSPVVTSWCCPHCALIFDDQRDRNDHIDLFHTTAA